MRRFMIFFLLVFAGAMQAQDTYSTERLKDVYDLFLCEEQNTTAEVHVTGPCTTPIPGSGGGGHIITPCGALTDRPTIAPLAQASTMGLSFIPIVLVNDTGLPDSDVFFVV